MSIKADLCERLYLEARQERICADCGAERRHVRVYRPEGPSIVGMMQLVCFNCHPEFVTHPYEPWDRPVLIGGK